jgi:hypothetical protein
VTPSFLAIASLSLEDIDYWSCGWIAVMGTATPIADTKDQSYGKNVHSANQSL